MATDILSLSHWGAFVAEVENGRIVGARPFAGDPAPSPMLAAIPDWVHGATRIDRPMVRAGFRRHRAASGGAERGREPFVAVSWEEALDLVAAELTRVRATHGDSAVFGGSYGWSSAGRFHHARSQVRRFLFSTGGCVDQVTNYSWGAAQVLLPHVIGSYQPVTGRITSWDSVATATDTLVAFGGLKPGNWQVTSGGAGQHVMPGWLDRALTRGMRLVVVGPCREDAPPGAAAEWVPVRPGTDTALMLALAREIVAAGRHDRAFLARCCTGFEAFERYLAGTDDGQPKSAAWAASITGLPASAILALAERIAGGRSLLTASWSLQRADHGEQPYWALIALAAVLGQIGLPGGGFAFGHGSMNGAGNPTAGVPVPALPTGANPTGLAVPVARFADMLRRPGDGIDFDGGRFTFPDIRLVYWAGGNPFHHHQDLNRLLEAWRRPETIVVHDIHWTATARYADVVLPATTPLERNDLGGSSRDRFLFLMHQAIPPVALARNDHDIFRDLAARLGREAAFTEGLDEMGWIRRLYAVYAAGAAARGIAVPGFDEAWAAGVVETPAPAEPFVMFREFRDDPDSHPLATPSGRIELYSERIAGFGYADCLPHPAWLEPSEWLGAGLAARYPLHLLSGQPVRRLHGQMDPGPVSLAGKRTGREPVALHPDDAAARGIVDGALVRVFNDRGATLAAARLTDGVRRGVVMLETGAWYDPVEPGVPGSLEKHGQPNVLTRDAGTSKLAQATVAQTALVEVEPYEGPPLAVTAFDPPETSPAGPMAGDD